MKKINSILVPVDFSSNSLAALKYAAHLARKNSYKINLLNVVPQAHYIVSYPDFGADSPHIISTLEDLESGIIKDNERRLMNISGLKIFKGIISRIKVTDGGSIYQEIVDYAEVSKSGLIVMGTKGTTSAKKIFLGTNAERVIRLTSKPVIAIGRRAESFKMKKVVFASDFSKEAYTAYPAINSIIGPFNACVHLLWINSGDDSGKMPAEMKKFGTRYPGKFLPAIRPNREIDEGIVRYSKSIKADLIALGVHRKKGIRRMLGNRILEGILRLTTIPVLAVDIP